MGQWQVRSGHGFRSRRRLIRCLRTRTGCTPCNNGPGDTRDTRALMAAVAIHARPSVHGAAVLSPFARDITKTPVAGSDGHK